MLKASEKSNARILVIDDDPLFRNLMVSFLRREYFVSVASDGSQGFYKALEYPPDVAIVDVQMAVWDGLQTLKAFRSHPLLNKTKIIMLTSDASKETVIAAIQGGANDYIIKTSFSKSEFLDKVRKFAQPSFMPSVKTPHSSKRQNESPFVGTTNQNAEGQIIERRSINANPCSVQDQLTDLPLDQTEEEQLQELMEDWD